MRGRAAADLDFGYTARVVKWVDERGYGFVRLPHGRDIFVHIKVLSAARLGVADDASLVTLPR